MLGWILVGDNVQLIMRGNLAEYLGLALCPPHGWAERSNSPKKRSVSCLAIQRVQHQILSFSFSSPRNKVIKILWQQTKELDNKMIWSCWSSSRVVLTAAMLGLVALSIWYPDTETVEGTREAMRRPRGRRVLRAFPMVAKGPLKPILGRRRGWDLRSGVDDDQIWRDCREEEADREESCQCVQEIVEAVLPTSPEVSLLVDIYLSMKILWEVYMWSKL